MNAISIAFAILPVSNGIKNKKDRVDQNEINSKSSQNFLTSQTILKQRGNFLSKHLKSTNMNISSTILLGSLGS